MRTVRLFTAGLFAMLIGSVAWAAACDGFADVDSTNNQYCQAVAYIKDKGVTLGCGDGSNYCPNDYVTRLQMALFMSRMGRGGVDNFFPDAVSAIGGGQGNVVFIPNAFDAIGGGHANQISGSYSTISGGEGNYVAGGYAAIPGGIDNYAGDTASFAAGANASANFPGQFVWADNSGVQFRPGIDFGWGGNGTNTFNVRSTGGVWLVTGINPSGVPTAGVYVNPGSGTWASTSDRAVKENFVAIDARDVLSKVSSMPIQSWNYIAEGKSTRHLGPVSQDFYGAFKLGPDDKSITTIDEGGVALAAIQGLNAKLEARDAIIAEQARQLAELRNRMDSIERTAAH